MLNSSDIIALSSLAVAVASAAFTGISMKRDSARNAESHALSKADLLARQEPKIQISEEVFCSYLGEERLVGQVMDHDNSKLFSLRYSALIANKSDAVARIEAVAIEVGSAIGSPLAEPTANIGAVHIAGPILLAAGEEKPLQADLSEEAIEMMRLFFDNPEVLVFAIAFTYDGYIGKPRKRRYEIYRYKGPGVVVSKGNYNAEGGIPRTYLL